ncbi:MAG: ComF family protein, partial [Patescibacteria group bacterium]|nr:ComF family protein [Patescibacteria group bacterium]
FVLCRSNAALELVFPSICQICGKRGLSLCDFCASALRLNPLQACAYCEKPAANGVTHPACARRHGLDGALAAGLFPQIQELIHYYKYLNDTALFVQGDGHMAKFLDGFSYLEYFSAFELVPVPLHEKRLRFRGFNQSELITQTLSELSGIKLNRTILKRTKNTETQTHFNREARQQNLREAFRTAENEYVKGKDFLLIDDVITTGATLSECARTLKRAGADRVWGLVLARG